MTAHATLDIRPGQLWQLHFGAPDAPEPWGSGRRVLVVLGAGRKWVTAVCPHTLHVAKVHRNDWRKHRPKLLDARPRHGVTAVRRRRTLFNQLGLPYPVKTLRDYLRAIERGAGS